jgi:hypothetical protein
MDEVGEEEKGQGAPGLGTSSKLLEPGAKGEAIPPPLQLVADPIIHFTGDVNKIIKYNDKIIFSLYILYFYYNMINTIKNINYTTIYVSQKTYLSDFINMC